ncbi:MULTISPECIES: hypothetical protein [Streptomyces]|uniref:DUF2269 domain-containing protein n=1 Tax=Streptomyces dengpaensis TaxID=2049881 RepID=A0ABM6SJG2_9ACTN|nr:MULTISPECIES: hypothetical protein [Streptomyces]AVH54789.1 hypothetical protein C4B68_02060 [Streptomyces dengpaensis]PIB04018.1 hypothetical protein B1C81_34615 [Streptomyces sp. HG99]
MAMPPGIRKATLTAHVASSVGWLGWVAVFLVPAVVGLNGDDPQRVRGSYLAMEVTGWYVIVPLAFASLLTGFVQSLGTTWGLFRHYWLLAKLALTALATFLLLLHMQVADQVADAAARTNLTGTDLGGMRGQLVFDAAAALVVLLTTTALSVFKPRGITRYRWRVQHGQRAERAGGASAMDTAAPVQT